MLMSTRDVPEDGEDWDESGPFECIDLLEELSRKISDTGIIANLRKVDQHQVRQAIHAACTERGIECKEPVE